MSEQRYAVVTAISSFRMRYVMPIREGETVHSLQDLVTCNEVEDFSQLHLGEQIVDAVEMAETEVLTLFDSDNDYLKSWDKERKVDWIKRLRAEHM